MDPTQAHTGLEDLLRGSIVILNRCQKCRDKLVEVGGSRRIGGSLLLLICNNSSFGGSGLYDACSRGEDHSVSAQATSGETWSIWHVQILCGECLVTLRINSGTSSHLPDARAWSSATLYRCPFSALPPYEQVSASKDSRSTTKKSWQDSPPWCFGWGSNKEKERCRRDKSFAQLSAMENDRPGVERLACLCLYWDYGNLHPRPRETAGAATNRYCVPQKRPGRIHIHMGAGISMWPERYTAERVKNYR